MSNKTIKDILMYLHVHKERKVSNKSLENLTVQKPSWNNLPTKAIRIPKIFADQILEVTRLLDSNQSIESEIPVSNKNTEQAISILEQSLKLPANKGGAIKNEIREAIKLLHGCIKNHE